MSPSEKAAALVLRAWVDWPGGPDPTGLLIEVGDALRFSGLVQGSLRGDNPTHEGQALLDALDAEEATTGRRVANAIDLLDRVKFRAGSYDGDNADAAAAFAMAVRGPVSMAMLNRHSISRKAIAALVRAGVLVPEEGDL